MQRCKEIYQNKPEMNQKLKNSPPYHNISMEETEPMTPGKTLVAPMPML